MLDSGRRQNTHTAVSLTNDYESSTREIVEFYNLRGGKERIFDDMNTVSWTDCPNPSWQRTLCLLLRQIYPQFGKAIIHRLDVKRFDSMQISRIKAFVFRFGLCTSQVDQEHQGGMC